MMNMIEKAKYWLVLWLVMAILYKPEGIKASLENEEDVNTFKIISDHWNQPMIQRYNGYITNLKQRWLALRTRYIIAATDNDLSKLSKLILPIFDEIGLYGVNTKTTLAMAKNQPLLVIGYFRSAVGTIMYNSDIARVLLAYAYLDLIVPYNPACIQLKKDLWIDNQPAPKTQYVLKKAESIANYAFLFEWLLACMEREKKGYKIDISKFNNIFNAQIKKYILLNSDNFFNIPFLDWISKKWPEMFTNPDMLSFFRYHNPCLALIIANKAALTAQQVEDNLDHLFNEAPRYATVLFPLALHGKLKKAHFPAKYIDELDISYLLITKQTGVHARAGLLRYCLRYIITREKCKAMLKDAIYNKCLLFSENRLEFCNHCNFKRGETYFFSIFVELFMDALKTPEALKMLEGHPNTQEVWRQLGPKYQTSINIYRAINS